MSIDLESIDLDKLFHKTISFITTNKNSTYIPILKTKYDELINQTTNLKRQTTNLKKQIKKLKRKIKKQFHCNSACGRG